MNIAKLQPSEIPSGTKMYDLALNPDETDFIISPGLVRMRVGPVGVSTHVPMGTHLSFESGSMRVHVARINMSAAEINEIQQLVTQLLQNAFERNYVRNVGMAMDAFKFHASISTSMMGAVGSFNASSDVGVFMKDVLGELGTWVEKLKQAPDKLNKIFFGILKQLHELGVVDVNHWLHGMGVGDGWPVHIYARERNW